MRHILTTAAALTAAILCAAPLSAAPPDVPPDLPLTGDRAPGPRSLRVGGPCTYADHPGTATILAVVPAVPDKNVPAPPYPGMTVTYVFKAAASLPIQGIHEEGKTQTLTLINGWPPGKRFLEKYGIRPGAALPCVLRIIRSGTCTPLLFEFPGIDLADYFEIEK